MDSDGNLPADKPLLGRVVPIPDPTTLTNQLVSRAVGSLREVVETRLDASDKAVAELSRSTETRVAAAVTQVKELYAEKFRLVEHAIETNRIAIVDRFELLDKQTIKAATDVKSAIDAAFAAVALGATQQYQAIAERFEVLDKQTIKAAADVKSAVDAAFAAAASGVAQQNQANFLASQKQEAAFTKQIDQLADNVRQISKAIGDQISDLKKTNDDKVGDLKDRIVAMEGRSSVSDPNTAGSLREMATAISMLKASSDQGQGGRQQRTESSTWIFGAVAAVVGIGALVLAVIEKMGH